MSACANVKGTGPTVVPEKAGRTVGNMPCDRSSLEALKNIIDQIDLLISTTIPLPENRTARCQELLRAATALADDLLKQAGAKS